MVTGDQPPSPPVHTSHPDIADSISTPAQRRLSSSKPQPNELCLVTHALTFSTTKSDIYEEKAKLDASGGNRTRILPALMVGRHGGSVDNVENLLVIRS